LNFIVISVIYEIARRSVPSRREVPHERSAVVIVPQNCLVSAVANALVAANAERLETRFAIRERLRAILIRTRSAARCMVLQNRPRRIESRAVAQCEPKPVARMQRDPCMQRLSRT
jgi:hypothetical protein